MSLGVTALKYHNKTVTKIKPHVAVKLISHIVKILQTFFLIYLLAAFILQDIYPCSTYESGTEAEHSLIM